MLGSAAAPDDRCSIDRLPVPSQVELIGAQALPAGPFVAPDGSRTAIPATCRLRGIARPSPNSRVGFELWLPAQGWNGRYYQLGNGGFAGNIHLPSLAAEAARGNAAAATDTGHVGSGFDASWASGHPQRLVDYGHRSIKATSDAAHALIDAYYGRPARWRYFAGCSNGGRQALMAAARYPDDWDGILAGAPANPWTVQLANFAGIQNALRRGPAAWLAPRDIALVQRAALASCTRAANVTGSVARDPRHCRFDPSILACRPGAKGDCLAPTQIEVVRTLQRAGYEPTSADSPDGWRTWIAQADPTQPSQLTFAIEAMRHLAGRPGWTIADFDPARDRAALQRLGELLDVPPDFGRFEARGGRILSYFGWADPVTAPRPGLGFYARVVAARKGAKRTQAFYRLFMVPGMAHCQGGLGPTAFGQSLSSPSAQDDRRHDIKRALEAWVEEGASPESIVAQGAAPGSRQDLVPIEP